jgi:cyclohexyl-isocyanide hydratase
MANFENLSLNRRVLMQLSALGLAAGAASGLQKSAYAQGSTEESESFARLHDKEQLNIGILIFPRMDQIDFTGPFAVLVRIPGAIVHVIGTEPGPFRDHKGMILTPEVLLETSPELDMLVVPGGPGQEALMENEPVLAFIRKHVAADKPLFSVCTGALICGAAGILQGRRATTHWSAFGLLPMFGAIPVDERVVVDSNIVTAAGVTAGIDGALMVAALLRGDAAAQSIQLDIQYAPEPPFAAGSPTTAPPDVLAEVKGRFQPLTDTRRQTANRFAQRHGIPTE